MEFYFISAINGVYLYLFIFNFACLNTFVFIVDFHPSLFRQIENSIKKRGNNTIIKTF